jgi:MFS family permease
MLETIDHSGQSREAKHDRVAATLVVAALISVLFAGSTLLTPLYVIYQERFGFPRLTLTLIYGVYVIGNLTALLLFGGVSDVVGRRRVAVMAVAAATASTTIFLFATGSGALYMGRILNGFAVGGVREPRRLGSRTNRRSG